MNNCLAFKYLSTLEIVEQQITILLALKMPFFVQQSVGNRPSYKMKLLFLSAVVILAQTALALPEGKLINFK